MGCRHAVRDSLENARIIAKKPDEVKAQGQSPNSAELCG